ncbi:hypothetical protein [Actinomadura parmotrematis]|uniref:DUF748 domain-containing protein n=1 Tax=Actinomadura parmotrematis TaxID=2864039 RepID=A0ABS7FPS9_9ACTN|nr:hypothetical protein [Actinomadura parmotrematis]MBW8481779.1 hypothetical protein [Actinomadura parmotrematis]
MNTATRLGAFAAGLAAVFGAALGLGGLVGPVGATAEDGHGSEHGSGHESGTPAAAAPPGGLQISAGGYTFHPRATEIAAGRRTDFRFTIDGPDARPVTRYEPLHGKPLHLIVARRDLSGFQHLHPVLGAGGVWSVPVTLADPGTYRFFTDVKPAGAAQATLGADVTVPGDQRPAPLPAASRTATVDGYEVRLDGDLAAGRSSALTFTVTRGGAPVTDLRPYLEAYGHLVALRRGDLAYLHVHPDGEPGDGRTRPGPRIAFHAEVPSAGTYRLYLDFEHGGTVRTAEFTATAR